MTPEQLRMEAQLYSLRASATRLTGKCWAAPYASSLHPFCPGSRRPRACSAASAVVSRPLLAHCFSLCDLRLFVIERMLLSLRSPLACAGAPGREPRSE